MTLYIIKSSLFLYMSIKQKLLDTIEGHPKLVAFSIGLGLTIAIGTVIGMFDHSHLASAVLRVKPT